MRRSRHPSRWSYKHNAYYYQVPEQLRDQWDGKTWFRLGKTEAEAYRTWYERIGHDSHDDLRTMAKVFDGYEQVVLPTLSASTQRGYSSSLRVLRPVFGEMKPGLIKPRHAYQFLDHRPPVAGNRELSVLIKALDFAVRKGVIDRNPIKGQVQRNSEKPRSRLVNQAELADFLQGAGFMLRGYVALKRITGVRQGQLLSIYLPRQWKEGILTIPSTKGGKTVEYEGGELEAVIDYILYQRWGDNVRHIGYLFTTRNGTPYTSDGFRSIWQRQMSKFVQRGGERFTEHDIRAMAASEADNLDHASALLGHQDRKTTNLIYRRKPSRVKALGTPKK